MSGDLQTLIPALAGLEKIKTGLIMVQEKREAIIPGVYKR